jgi:hypothetical protein
MMGHMPSENPWLVQINLDLRNCDLGKVLGRFMIRFEDLKIDCNDKLVIVYDGAHAIGKSMVG